MEGAGRVCPAPSSLRGDHSCESQHARSFLPVLAAEEQAERRFVVRPLLAEPVRQARQAAKGKIPCSPERSPTSSRERVQPLFPVSICSCSSIFSFISSSIISPW